MLCNNLIYCHRWNASKYRKSLLKKKKERKRQVFDIALLKVWRWFLSGISACCERFLVTHSVLSGRKLCTGVCRCSPPHFTWGPCTVFIVHLFLNTSRGPKILFLPANLTIASRVHAVINLSIINVQLPQLCTRSNGVCWHNVHLKSQTWRILVRGILFWKMKVIYF